ncbi:MAG: GTP-binding protein [Pseudomonadota bacterium]
MEATTQVILITGFLGSGKTTFLNRFIRHFPKDRKMMILMNEFGEMGLDGTLIEGEDLDILEISKGSIFCVCVKTDFIRALNTIAVTIRPDVLVVESTGVANPSDLKKDLNLSIFKGRFQLTEQICIIDAPFFEQAFETFVSVEKQIASSTVFLINKIDLATPDQIRNIHRIIHELHPDPEIMETRFAVFPPERFGFTPVSTGDTAADADAGGGGAMSAHDLDAFMDKLLEIPDPDTSPPDRLLSAVYQWEGGDVDGFRAGMDTLPSGLIRAKGILAQGNDLYLFNRVMNRSTLEPYTSEKDCSPVTNKIVFIGQPEAIAALEDSVSRIPGLGRQSVFDPMQGR